ncbi:MAG: nuclear transport factor 2 family protein [Acidobacteriota bacterium]|nr:nuclear transport factor 2 family protein [Acidobacteriota bacterium]
MNSFRQTLAFNLAILLYACSIPASQAQAPPALAKEVVNANRELDRRLMDAHALKDAAMVESLFSKSPEVFFIDPTGGMVKGPSNIRTSWTAWFDTLETIHGDIRDISYIPAGEGVIAVGTVIYTRKLKNGTADQKTVIWTDYRRMENGRWVYVFRHAHWPLEKRSSTETKK